MPSLGLPRTPAPTPKLGDDNSEDRAIIAEYEPHGTGFPKYVWYGATMDGWNLPPCKAAAAPVVCWMLSGELPADYDGTRHSVGASPEEGTLIGATPPIALTKTLLFQGLHAWYFSLLDFSSIDGWP